MWCGWGGRWGGSEAPRSRFGDRESDARFFQELKEVGGLNPAVEELALASTAPLTNCCATGSIQKDFTPDPWVGPGLYVAATPGYFEILDIPILDGRGFTDRDRVGAPMVALVSESFAEMLWPGESPLGKVISSGGMDGYFSREGPVWAEVVGVAADAKYAGLTGDVTPAYYFPLYQRPDRTRQGATMSLRARTGSESSAVEATRQG